MLILAVALDQTFEILTSVVSAPRCSILWARNALRSWGSFGLRSGRLVQRRPCGQRIHVIPPAYDLAVLDSGNRYEPVIVSRACGEHLPMHFVFERHDATIVRRMHDQRIASVEPDVASVPGIERYEVVAAARYPGPAREFIEEQACPNVS